MFVVCVIIVDMEVLTSRQNSCRFFRTLNRALLAKYIELKN